MTDSPSGGVDLPKKSSKSGLIILWTCIGVPVLLVGGCFALFAGDPGEGSPEGAEASSIVKCRGAVKDKLKAPTTAKFDNESATGSGTDGVYHVSGTVDSQNSFGAMCPHRIHVHSFSFARASDIGVSHIGRITDRGTRGCPFLICGSGKLTANEYRPL